MIELTGGSIPLETLRAVAEGVPGAPAISLAKAAAHRMSRSRATVEQVLASDEVVYGVNTGFGKLSDVSIGAEDLEALQVNLVRSHACGVGAPLSLPETRGLMLLRANVLAAGASGARPEVAERLVEMLNLGVHPIVPEWGSVGASGDLAPLAHLALVMIGEGEAHGPSGSMPGGEALQGAGLPPLRLQAKEGLALLNGTQAMSSVGGLALARCLHLSKLADAAGAMTLEALKGTPAAFDERIHALRPHPGQIESAARLRAFLADSEIRESHRFEDPRVQDAYSLRCMPQVHGAALGALDFARQSLETETGSVTDNPLVFPETRSVISGGNFHGAPLALAWDFAAIAMADLMSISERRIERLVNPDLNEGLPPFLARKPGVESGFMIAQVTAAALLAEARVLAHPSSVDNVPTSGGKEDHVSMGMTGALKLRRTAELAERIFAIELAASAEGLDHRKPLLPGARLRGVYEWVRSHFAPLASDRPLGFEFERLALAIRNDPSIRRILDDASQ
ncbi:MAG: histidine ammonia-lyase [Fimbriimonadaceae bacterium]|nr:histidine ammonia-lyase [Fimbriimonadaceae bacterium]NUM39629.1 histidine ammonia-lyase [Armatimonadota bacterium]